MTALEIGWRKGATTHTTERLNDCGRDRDGSEDTTGTDMERAPKAKRNRNAHRSLHRPVQAVLRAHHPEPFARELNGRGELRGNRRQLALTVSRALLWIDRLNVMSWASGTRNPLFFGPSLNRLASSPVRGVHGRIPGRGPAGTCV